MSARSNQAAGSIDTSKWRPDFNRPECSSNVIDPITNPVCAPDGNHRRIISGGIRRRLLAVRIASCSGWYLPNPECLTSGHHAEETVPSDVILSKQSRPDSSAVSVSSARSRSLLPPAVHMFGRSGNGSGSQTAGRPKSAVKPYRGKNLRGRLGNQWHNEHYSGTDGSV